VKTKWHGSSVVVVYQCAANWYCIAMMGGCMIDDCTEYGTVHIASSVPSIFINVEFLKIVKKSPFSVYM
jgi:hypothetical protein